MGAAYQINDQKAVCFLTQLSVEFFLKYISVVGIPAGLASDYGQPGWWADVKVATSTIYNKKDNIVKQINQKH
jgi:hypothetical protein